MLFYIYLLQRQLNRRIIYLLVNVVSLAKLDSVIIRYWTFEIICFVTVNGSGKNVNRIIESRAIIWVKHDGRKIRNVATIWNFCLADVLNYLSMDVIHVSYLIYISPWMNSMEIGRNIAFMKKLYVISIRRQCSSNYC